MKKRRTQNVNKSKDEDFREEPRPSRATAAASKRGLSAKKRRGHEWDKKVEKVDNFYNNQFDRDFSTAVIYGRRGVARSTVGGRSQSSSGSRSRDYGRGRSQSRSRRAG